MPETPRSAVEQLTNQEVFVLTLYGECRGEPYLGQVAVACVIRNRVLDKRWPSTYKEVCLQPKQFSCWNDLPEIGWFHAAASFPQTKQLYYIMEGVSTWMIPDVTQGANHYLNPFAAPPEPQWARGTKRITLWPGELVGAHAFYRL